MCPGLQTPAQQELVTSGDQPVPPCTQVTQLSGTHSDTRVNSGMELGFGCASSMDTGFPRGGLTHSECSCSSVSEHSGRETGLSSVQMPARPHQLATALASSRDLFAVRRSQPGLEPSWQ